jgi:hypothetical protein
MSAKQSQITSFFQNKKQKTNDFDENSASVDILSNNLNKNQDRTELCVQISSSEPPETSTSSTSILISSAPVASPSSTSAPVTSPSSTSASLTSPLSISILSPSPLSPSKDQCQLSCCTSDYPFVPQIN